MYFKVNVVYVSVMDDVVDTESAESRSAIECEEAVKECEVAIRECEEAALSCRYLLSVCVIIILLLGALLVYFNLPYLGRGDERLKVYYMMPLKCVDCDVLMVNEVASEAGLVVEDVVSDSVNRPSILIIYGNASTLASASSRLNILSALCFFASHNRSCELRKLAAQEVVKCLGGYNISEDTVLLYTQYECDYCRNLSSWARELRKEGYKFEEIDLAYKQDKEIADRCLSSVIDLRGVVPQIICPANGVNRMGSLNSRDELRSFAESCRG